MSGGSMDYLYSKIYDECDKLDTSKNALRVAFSIHLRTCADALHDIEWVDSGDYADGDEYDAIRKALGPEWKKAVIGAAEDRARAELKRLQEAIDACKAD